MPNHVYSNLVVSGDKSEVNRFIEVAKFKEEGEVSSVWANQVLNANAFIRYPRQFELLDKKHNDKNPLSEEEEKELMVILLENGNLDITRDGFNQGGYEWCTGEWGTKWGFYDVNLASTTEFSKTKRVFYNFLTAWSPPYPLLIKMSKDFPTLKFSYEGRDEGGGFDVRMILKDGKILKEKDIMKERSKQ